MACPFLWGNELLSCSASRELHVPGLPELRRFCSPRQEDRFTCCPVYLRSSQRHAAPQGLPTAKPEERWP